MKINIKATGLELTPALESHLREKLSYLERFLGQESDAVHAEVEIGKTTNHHKHGDVFRAEVNLHAGGRSFYAEHTAEDLYAAIDQMKNEVTSELRGFTKKQHTLLRRGGRRIKNMLRNINPWKK